MDLTRANGQEIGSTLDRIGMSWSRDSDGDVRVRFRSSKQPWIDAVFYKLEQDFSIRGQFLNGRAVPQGDGTTRWEVPLDAGQEITAVGQKVVSVYLMPQPGYVGMQIHASIAPLGETRPMHIRVIPGSEQVSKIESSYPGVVGVERDMQLWMSTSVTGTDVDDWDFGRMVQEASQVGLAMFDGPFTGWIVTTGV